MAAFSAPDDSSDEEETQQTPVTGQRDVSTEDLWGYLFPLNSLVQRIDFNNTRLSYRLGRHYRNDVVLPGLNISTLHCAVSWNGKGDLQSQVIIHDNSRNGTLVNGKTIGKGHRAPLHHGDVVSFGSHPPGPSGGPPIEYDYIYVHQGTKASRTGVYVQYKIGTELGKGAFATVFKATHTTTNKLYAVKIINTKRHLAKDSQMVMFAREIEVMLRLEHVPNIVRLREMFKDESSIALVMEFVSGGNLLDYILRKRGLAERDTKYIAKQMCEAMDYMHKNSIAHRDLKPENVLLTDTIPVLVKIADFGLAKAFDDETFLKTMCGTPNYVAPEVIVSGENYDILVDSWSMGVTIFFMLTNASPFIEVANQDIVGYIRTRTIQWSNLEKVGVSHFCRNFVYQLLIANPVERMSLSNSLKHTWLLSL